MAAIDVKVRVDTYHLDRFVKLAKAHAIDMTLGGAVGGAGIVGLLHLLGLSELWFVLPAIGALLYRSRVSTRKLKQEMAADESAYEIAMDGE